MDTPLLTPYNPAFRPNLAAIVFSLVFTSIGSPLAAQAVDVASQANPAPATEEGSVAPAPPGTVVPAENSPAPAELGPSRFAGEDKMPYIVAHAAALSMADREVDPFGLNQDPDVKPVERTISPGQLAKRKQSIASTPLSEIVKRIRVTTIMPTEKKFLVGTRSFKEGDEFPLIYQGQTMRIKVTEVGAQRIRFRNLDKSEDASLETGMLPPGMASGSGDFRPPGLVLPVDNLPLELDAGRNPDLNN